MEKSYLNREQYKELLINEFEEEKIDDRVLAALIEVAKTYWDIEIVGNNYFLSKILEQFMKQGIDCRVVIDKVYDTIPNDLFFSVEELDAKFVQSLFQNQISSGDLENDILEALKNSQ